MCVRVCVCVYWEKEREGDTGRENAQAECWTCNSGMDPVAPDYCVCGFIATTYGQQDAMSEIYSTFKYCLLMRERERERGKNRLRTCASKKEHLQELATLQGLYCVAG